MRNTLHKIQSLYPLSSEAFELFISHLEEVNLPKGHQLFREGRTGSQLYIIEKGMARAYSVRDNKEITYWFGAEGDVAISYFSYVANKPGYETVELLEDAVLYSISQEKLQELYSTNIEISNWGRKLAEYELIRTEQAFVVQQSLPAAIRYQQLLDQNPHLIRRVQLGYIASYLGVTQVTLSRIRAGNKMASMSSSLIALPASFSEPASALPAML